MWKSGSILMSYISGPPRKKNPIQSWSSNLVNMKNIVIVTFLLFNNPYRSFESVILRDPFIPCKPTNIESAQLRTFLSS